MKELKGQLCLDEWLELIKEDKNLNGAYFSIAQYVDLIEKENQELKKHLKVPKACNLKTLEDYKSYYEDATKEQMLEDTYIDYCAYVNLAHRYSKLKKQLEELNFIIGLRQKRNLIHKFDKEFDEADKKKNPNRDYAEITPDAKEEYIKEFDKNILLKKQQQGFIKYLEDEINKIKNDIFANALTSEDIDLYVLRVKLEKLEEILQKYKEIIGTTNE